jgi:hypothetical protein
MIQQQQEASWFNNAKGDSSLMMTQTRSSDGSSPRYFEPDQPQMSQDMYSSYSSTSTVNNGQQRAGGDPSFYQQPQSWLDNRMGDSSLMMEPTSQTGRQTQGEDFNYQFQSNTPFTESSSSWVDDNQWFDNDMNPQKQSSGYMSETNATPNWFDSR